MVIRSRAGAPAFAFPEEYLRPRNDIEVFTLDNVLLPLLLPYCFLFLPYVAPRPVTGAKQHTCLLNLSASTV